MPSRHYSYLDIAALDLIRPRFAAGDALAVLTPALDAVVWANGAGATLFGYSDISSITGTDPQIGFAAKRQITSAAGYPRIGRDRAITVRLASGLMSRAVSFVASEIVLPDGEDAILLAVPAAANHNYSAAEIASRAIAGLDHAGQQSAILDAAGNVIARSGGFDKLGIPGEALTAIVAGTQNERIVWQPLAVEQGAREAGLVLLRDEPATYLLSVGATVETPIIDAAAAQETATQDGQPGEISNGMTDPQPPIGEGDSLSGAPVAEAETPVEASTGPTDEPTVEASHEIDAPQELPSESIEATPLEAAAGPTDEPMAEILGDNDVQRQLPAEPFEISPAEAVASQPYEGIVEADQGSTVDAPGELTDEASAVIDETAAPAEDTADGSEPGAIEDAPVGSIEEHAEIAPDAQPEHEKSEAAELAAEVVVQDSASAEEELPSEAVTKTGADPAQPATDEPVATVAPSVDGDDAQAVPAADEPVPAIEVDRSAAPVRFVWKTDAEGRFSEISKEFAEVAGVTPADLIGRDFRTVAEQLGIDRGGEIAGLLERRDTWSGRAVLWPIMGTDLRLPVDLAALPTYDRDRNFAGFRGFGVARVADAVVDPDASEPFTLPVRSVAADAAAAAQNDGPGGNASDTAAESDPFRGEVPILTIVPKQERRTSDKVIRLAEHRGERALSPGEQNAFREIGDRLKKENGASASPSNDARRADNDQPVKQAEPAAEAQQEPTLPDDQPIGGGGAYLTPPDAAAADAIGPKELPSLKANNGQQDDTARADSEAEEPVTKAQDADADPAMPDGNEVPVGAQGEIQPVQPEPDASKPAHAYMPSAFAIGVPQAESEPMPVDTSILEQLPVPVLIHAGDVLHYANGEFFDLTGYATLGDLDAAGGLDALFGEPYPIEDDDAEPGRKLRLRTSEGLEYPVEAFLQSVPWGAGKALLLSLRRSWRQPVTYPITQPVAPPVDPDLEARVAEMRAIVDTATDGVMLIKPDGTIRSISRAAEALFGFDSEDVADKPFASLFAIESQRAARDYLNGLSDHGVASVLNDGREVIGRESQGRFIPLFMTIGKLPNDSGYCAVVRDITQWKRAEEDLTQARAQAERASSQKTDFLARVSHEIRTPLNAIIGFSELMLDEKFGPIGNDRYKDYLRDINRSGNHVLDLVNDLLDISKIEAGQQEMSYEAVSLNDTLTETVAMMQPQANRERVIIRSSFASRLPEVVADLRSIRQIALNLLSNAIRYTPAGGQVIVSTAYEPSGDVVMRVRDTGIGMSHAEIEQALKPFRQINALKRTRGDGTGLGLPLTKAMVEANRARFIINSTPGEGTLVEITFPSTRVLAD